MIRINLLQLKRKKKAKPLPAFIVLSVFVLLAMSLGITFFYMNLSREVKRLSTVKTTNAAKIEELKKKVKEVDDFEAKIKIFQERKEIIESLRKNQSLPVKVLNELSYTLADGVWLNDMAIRASDITLNGYAFTNTNVVEFVNNLKKSSLFSEVYLVESKEASVEKVDVYGFQMKFRVSLQ